ncbi:MAG: DNA repair protein RadC [Prevotellaceae bacterium]|jgi:DNA repair protein RadC|nr:DNA repair protein RadC [Prevotellaceae bacterium]
MQSLKIKEWSPDDRPREKMLQYGAKSLSNAELLAIIIGSGSKNETAVDVAKQLLVSSNNNICELGKKSINDFVKIKGIGSAKAVSIAAALELGHRCRNDNSTVATIKTSFDIFNIFQPVFSDLMHEEFWIMLLNNACRVISKYRISQGGISSTATDIKLIAKHAIDNLASSVVAVHNHPSQNVEPSEEDKKLTVAVKSALNLFRINLIDHLIISDSNYFSFADNGLL